jgi:hypothetical protein
MIIKIHEVYPAPILLVRDFFKPFLSPEEKAGPIATPRIEPKLAATRNIFKNNQILALADSSFRLIIERSDRLQYSIGLVRMEIHLPCKSAAPQPLPSIQYLTNLVRLLDPDDISGLKI